MKKTHWMGLIVETMINELQEGQYISFKLKHNEKKYFKKLDSCFQP